MAAFLLSSCTTIHRIPLAVPPQTQVVLKENNYKMKKKVSGEWSATYVLGLGGTSRESLANNSVAEMIDKAQLKDNQALVNTTTAVSTKYIFGNLITEITAVSTGYVIEFVDPNQATISTPNSVSGKGKDTQVGGQESSDSQPVVNEGNQTVASSTNTKKESRPLKNKLPEKLSSTYESFRSGRIYNMSKNEKNNTERAFVSEIEADLEKAQTMDELDVINMKIGYLNQYAVTNSDMKSTVKRLKDELSAKLQDL